LDVLETASRNRYQEEHTQLNCKEVSVLSTPGSLTNSP
jgi:hypothetical protein